MDVQVAEGSGWLNGAEKSGVHESPSRTLDAALLLLVRNVVQLVEEKDGMDREMDRVQTDKNLHETFFFSSVQQGSLKLIYVPTRACSFSVL